MFISPNVDNKNAENCFVKMYDDYQKILLNQTENLIEFCIAMHQNQNYPCYFHS